MTRYTIRSVDAGRRAEVLSEVAASPWTPSPLAPAAVVPSVDGGRPRVTVLRRSPIR